MAKHRVQLFNQSRGVEVDTDATPGATVGVDLFWPDGAVVSAQALSAAMQAGAAPPGGGATVYWRTIMEVPPNVTALQNTETTGLYVLTGPGGSATRTLTTNTLSLQNASGVDGDPVVDLGELEDAGTGALLAVERDQYGRVAGTKPATITGVEGEVTVEHGDAVGGLPTIGLADVPDQGGGTLQRIQRDGKGRVSGTSEATTDDLPEGSNLYFTDERADARVDAGIAEHVAQPDPHPQYLQAGEETVQSVNGQTGEVELAAADVGAATAAQGAKADSAVQPGDLAAVATSGAYGDLSGLPSLGTAASANVGDFEPAGAAASAESAAKSYADGKITQAITDGDTTHAPSGDAVFDALAGKVSTEGNATIKAAGDPFVLTLEGYGDANANIFRFRKDRKSV